MQHLWMGSGPIALTCGRVKSKPLDKTGGVPGTTKVPLQLALCSGMSKICEAWALDC